MISLDTNILARLILRDDDQQMALIETITQQPLFVATTVLLELGWLLMSRYQMSRGDVALSLTELLRTPNIRVSDSEMVDWAIARFAAGGDFADMLHIVASRPATTFLTFDVKVKKHAGDASPVAVEVLR